jgi:hypothetical protein
MRHQDDPALHQRRGEKVEHHAASAERQGRVNRKAAPERKFAVAEEQMRKT